MDWNLGLDLYHFLKVPSLVFPDIAQDCSLGQCLTASRDEASKKIVLAKIGVEMIFSILMFCCQASTQTCLFEEKIMFRSRDI